MGLCCQEKIQSLPTQKTSMRNYATGDCAHRKCQGSGWGPKATNSTFLKTSKWAQTSCMSKEIGGEKKSICKRQGTQHCITAPI